MASVAVVGPGAIGTTIAAALRSAGGVPLIAGRTPRDRLELRRGDELIVVPGPVLTEPPAEPAVVDLLFLAVKATQVAGAAPWLAALCGPGTAVCVLQNGLEQVSIVEPYAVGARVVPSVVWFPAQSQPDGSVWLRGAARLTVPDEPASTVVAAALRDTWCEVEVAADFHSVAWRKLVQNAFAGLMVLTGRRSGMFARQDIADLSLAYLRECVVVARADGAQLSDDLPREILERFQTQPPDLGTSILADREAGRPLEWEARNGVVQRRGRTHGIRTPISDVVVPLLAAASDGPG